MSRDRAVDLLARLVAVDSVNPALVPGGTGEQAIAELVAAELRAGGLDAELQPVAPGRPNVIGELRSRGPGRTLLLCGHLDTVGVEGMERPFDPVERDGCLYGRGAYDMKAGVTAMVDAACRLAAEGGLERGRLLVAGVADEEHASLGAEALMREHRADVAIVTEPTALRVVMGHKGFAWVRVETRGVAAHGSDFAAGRDAILRMGRVLGRLEELERELRRGPAHSLLGPPSLHASLVQGGKELSTYPERCVLDLERRTVEGEADDEALTEVRHILDALKREDPELEASAELTFARRPYVTPAGSPLPALLAEAVQRRRGAPAETGAVAFWTDAAVLGHAGIPTVVFGPGGAGAHALVEYAQLDELVTCRDVLLDVARRFLEGA
jgi:acetylornithine deacetylase